MSITHGFGPKIPKISVDGTPTQGSQNPVSSGGVYGALQSINTSLGQKAETSTVNQLSTTVAGKADASTVSQLSNTVSQLSTTVAGKADTSTVNQLSNTVAGKADTSTVNQLSGTVTQLSTAVAGKADASTVAGKADVDSTSENAAVLYNKCLWKKNQIIPPSYTVGTAIFTAAANGGDDQYATTEIKYSASIAVSDDGTVGLQNPTTYGAYYNGYSTFQSYVRGKYFTTALDTHSTVYFVKSNATVSRSSASPYQLSIPAAIVTGIPKSYSDENEYEWGTETSHVDGGESGGYKWTKLGKYDATLNLIATVKNYPPLCYMQTGYSANNYTTGSSFITHDVVLTCTYDTQHGVMLVYELTGNTALDTCIYESHSYSSSNYSGSFVPTGCDYFILSQMRGSAPDKLYFFRINTDNKLSYTYINVPTGGSTSGTVSVCYCNEDYVIFYTRYGSGNAVTYYIYSFISNTTTNIQLLNSSVYASDICIRNEYIYYFKADGVYRIPISNLSSEELVVSIGTSLTSTPDLLYNDSEITMWKNSSTVYLLHGSTLTSSNIPNKYGRYGLFYFGNYNGKSYFYNDAGYIYKTSNLTNLDWLSAPLKTSYPKISLPSSTYAIRRPCDFSGTGVNPQKRFDFKIEDFYIPIIDDHYNAGYYDTTIISMNELSVIGVDAKNSKKFARFFTSSSSYTIFIDLKEYL